MGSANWTSAPALEDPALRARWCAALRRRADQEAAWLEGQAADHLRVLAEGQPPLAESESRGEDWDWRKLVARCFTNPRNLIWADAGEAWQG